jgi:hypothetical protein
MLRNHLDHGGTQLDLFRPAPSRPTWQTLPVAVTQRVQRLLARLLQEHRTGRPEPRGGKGASDE